MTEANERRTSAYEQRRTNYERVIMKIVIIGGTGLIGSKVIEKLTAHGHDAVSAAPSTGVNTLTGEGLAETLTDADVVVDVSNSPSFEDDAVMNFFRTSTQNILSAEKESGVTHHVALSVVGAERVPDSGYLRAKAAQEKLIKESGVPHSLVHATQFFEFVTRIADEATDGETARLSTGFVQPIAAEDVATAVARAAAGPASNSTREIGGPEKFGLDEFVRTGLAYKNDPRAVIGDPEARYFNAVLHGEELVPGNGATIFETRFTDWLETQSAAKA